MGNARDFVLNIIGNDKASKVVDGVGDAVGRNSEKWNSFRTKANVALAAAGAAVVAFATESVKAYAESEVAQGQLNDAYARFPALADVSLQSLRDLNSELSLKTKYDDDATASGQAVLAQFNLTGQQLTQLTPLLQDYAAKTGKDLPTAAQDLGKAIMGQGRALKNVGIDFQDTGTAAGNFDQLVAGLRSQVGGYAEQEGQTAAGQTEILKNQFGEIQETVGGALTPTLMTLSGVLLDGVNWINNNTGAAAALAVTFGVVAGAIGIAANWVTISTTAMRIAAAAQWLWNAAMSANPIGIVIAAIGALVAAIVWCVTNWDKVKAAGAAAWNGIKSAWDGAGRFFSGIGDGIKNAFKGAFNAVARWWNNGPGAIGFTVPDWVPLVGGRRFDIPNIPMLASGGDITRTGLAIVGEAGPELLRLPAGAQVQPLSAGGSPSLPGGGSVHIEHFHADGMSAADVGEALAWELGRVA